MKLRLIVSMAALVALASTVRADSSGPSVVIQPCTSEKLRWQQWTTGPKNEIVLKSNGACLDVADYSTADQSEVYTFSPCHPDDPDPTHQNEAWSVNSNGTITEIMSGKCLDRSNYGTTPGTQVWLYHCTGADNQKWAWNATDGTIRATDSGLCLDAGSPTPRPCDVDPGKSLPFCDHTLDTDTRVNDLVSRLTLDEKIPLFANGAGSVSRFNIPSYQWWSEALHGVAGSPGVHFGGDAPCATSFPQVITTGATFNKTLWHKIGSTISTEARAMNNLGRAGLTFWAPNINQIPDPRWGRGQETPGEDPYVTGQYAAFYITGMQEGEDPNHLKVSSCSKHYFDYNLENWHGTDRHHFNAEATFQDLSDTYLPAFESAVRYGRVSSLMCSYNAVNGVPSCANYESMTTMARETWGFEGYITSDCGAVADVINSHHYTKDADSTCNAVLSAGMDIDCGGYLPSNLEKAVNDGAVSNATVDAALQHLFKVQFRLGMFDPVDDQPYLNYTADMINTAEHQQLALEAAQQGIVLLKNSNSRLPLSGSPNVAVIGPNGNVTKTLQGNYFGNAPYIISPLAGIQNYTSASFVSGCKDVNCKDDSGFSDAVKAAKNADVVVVFIGLDQSQESEGHDRDSIALPGMQDELVKQVAAASKNPIIVGVITGGSVDLTNVRDNDNVGAIVWCGYPGQSGGQAIADVIFGTVNPSGRLPYTIYPASFTNLSMFDNHMRPNKTSGNPGRTYRFYTGEPVFEYATGLSYTTFTFSNSTDHDVVVSASAANALLSKTKYRYIRDEAEAQDEITIKVTNTGHRPGATPVIAFLHTPTPPGIPGAPIKSVVGFEKVLLQPGESTTVQFPITPHDISAADIDGTRHALRGQWTFTVAGAEDEVQIPVTVV